MTCPTCLRPLATEADEAIWQARQGTTEPLPGGWPDEQASHLCWTGVGYENVGCEPPEWWESVTPLVVQTLRAEIDELRLTLAAEQGRPEGAPSEGWAYDGSAWSKDYPDGSTALITGPRGRRNWMRASWPVLSHPAHFLGRGFEFPSDRAAMIAADNAQQQTSHK